MLCSFLCCQFVICKLGRHMSDATDGRAGGGWAEEAVGIDAGGRMVRCVAGGREREGASSGWWQMPPSRPAPSSGRSARPCCAGGRRGCRARPPQGVAFRVREGGGQRDSSAAFRRAGCSMEMPNVRAMYASATFSYSEAESPWEFRGASRNSTFTPDSVATSMSACQSASMPPGPLAMRTVSRSMRRIEPSRARQGVTIRGGGCD